jgi:hypothetical protein
MHPLLWSVVLVALLPACAVMRQKPESTRRLAIVQAAIAPNGEPEVGFVAVKRWFRLPWEAESWQAPARTLYLRPGTYSIELHCHEGPIYLHYAPSFKVSVAADSDYVLGCRPKSHEENFYLELLRSNNVPKPTAGDGLRSFRLLSAGSGLTRR